MADVANETICYFKGEFIPLADAKVPIFVLSTFETDYLLVRELDLHRSVEVLRAAGHEVDS